MDESERQEEIPDIDNINQKKSLGRWKFTLAGLIIALCLFICVIVLFQVQVLSSSGLMPTVSVQTPNVAAFGNAPEHLVAFSASLSDTFSGALNTAPVGNQSGGTFNILAIPSQILTTVLGVLAPENPWNDEVYLPTTTEVAGTISQESLEWLESYKPQPENFSGIARGLYSYHTKVYVLTPDDTVINPDYLKRSAGVKLTLLHTDSDELMDNTLWGYAIDATKIARDYYTGPSSADLGILIVTFKPNLAAEEELTFTLTAADAESFRGKWRTGWFIATEDWSDLQRDPKLEIADYADPDTRMNPAYRPVLPAGAAFYDAWKEDIDAGMRQFIDTSTSEIMAKIADIAEANDEEDEVGVADAANDLIIYTAQAKAFVLDVPVSDEMDDIRRVYVEGIDVMNAAGSYYWYGGLFGSNNDYREGYEAVQEGKEFLNKALSQADLTLIEKSANAKAPRDAFPHALYIDEQFVYQDTVNTNELSITMEDYHVLRSFTVNDRWGNLETVTSGRGYKFIAPLIDMTNLWNKGGDANSTSPKNSDFTLIAGVQLYKDSTPVGYMQPLGDPYHQETLQAPENREGTLIFKVPENVLVRDLFLKLNLGDQGEPVWRFVRPEY